MMIKVKSILISSILISLAVQTNWAIHNNFDLFEIRFLISILVLLVIVPILLKLVVFIFKPKTLDYEDKLIDSFLLLSGAFGVVIFQNLLIKIPYIIVYFLLFLYYISYQSNLKGVSKIFTGSVDLFKKIINILSPVLRAEIDEEEDTVIVKLYGKDFQRASANQIKELILQITYDLPGREDLKNLHIDIEKLNNLDQRFSIVFSAFEQYKELFKIEEVKIKCSGEKRDLLTKDPNMAHLSTYL